MSLESQQLPEWNISGLDETEAPAVDTFHGKPLLILLFSRGCPGCMGRAIPFSLTLHEQFPQLQIVAIHTRFEGPEYSQHQVKEVKLFFKLSYPLYVDQGKKTYERYQAEGTPHWLLVDERGVIIRSMWGSMANVQNRLQYALEEILGLS